MIQRIQSVWLFLAAIIIAALLYFGYYRLGDGQVLHFHADYIGILIAAAISIVCLVALFSYKRRERQLNFIWLGLLLTLGLVAYMFYNVQHATSDAGIPAQRSGSYMFSAFLPILTLICLFLARTGIRKDQKMLKNYDRLR